MADRVLGAIQPKPIFVHGNPSFISETVPNGALDPGELVGITLLLTNVGYAASTNLLVTLLNTGGITSASAPQSFGFVPGHGGMATLAFSFAATGDCGSTNFVAIQLQDDSTNLQTASFAYQLGTPRIPLVENFDALTPPSLPAGWTVSTAGSGLPWRTTTNPPSTSGKTSLVVVHSGNVGDSSITSPPFTISSTSAQISFSHYQSGSGYPPVPGVLEISTNGGPFIDVLAIGGSFVTGAYDSIVSSQSPSPLAGRDAWSYNSGIIINTLIQLSATFAGRTVQLRFRAATGDDCSHCAGDPYYSWRVDSVVCDDGLACNVPLTLSGPRRSGEQIEFGWNAFPGRYYQMQYKTNLSQANWLSIGGAILANDSEMIWSHSAVADPQRYYRLLVNP